MPPALPTAGPALTTSVAEFVLKVASRCDLSCDHCYVYADPDRGWLRRPRVMRAATVRAAAARIAEHALRHRLRRVAVVLHGGEPLLLGPVGLRTVLEALRSTLDPVVTLEVHLQSNGLRLTPAVCEVLAEHHVRVGVSLDGDEQANDRHRRSADGRGSHARVVRALELLRTPPHRALYGGLLATIDIGNDPVGVYEALRREDPPRVDLLLPHAHWDRPPPRPDGAAAPYADWLLAIYDRWTADGRPVPIRTFDSLLSLEAEGPSGTEALGATTVPVAVVETDGTWEQVDSLKTVSADTPSTGLDVSRHSVDDVAAHAHALGHHADGLSDTCRACPVVDTCGGGLFAHRFGRGNGFRNPSVYCADLYALITGIRARRRTRPRDAAALPGLPDPVLHELADGRPSVAALAHLVAVEYALDRALLARVAARVTHPADRTAWALLSRLDRQHPTVVRAVLGHPYLRVRGTRALAGGNPDALTGLVAAVAAAVAVRAGVAAAVDVPTRQGTLCLPGVGALAQPGVDTATVVSGPGGWSVRVGGGPAVAVAELTGWRPVRRGGGVAIDDADPDRDCFARPVSPAGAGDLDRLGRTVAGARALVRAAAAPLAAQVDTLVRVVTPARPLPHGAAVAATATAAFGAVALGPASPEATATLLVREAARTAMHAVEDVCALTEPDGPSIRLAPRYARAAVVELALARGGGRDPSVATELDALRAELDVLVDGTDWTATGRLLLSGLRERVERWSADGR